MLHHPVQIKNLELSLPNKICFQEFNYQINYGDRIAIIGNNGSGKSTLLKILQNKSEATNFEISIPDNVVFGYVPQIISEFEHLSGGQRFNKALTQALNLKPNILLLDEPTNHLDFKNRKNLIRMLQNYDNTLIIVSHDTELLSNCVNTLWHINNGRIEVFCGNYDDYTNEQSLRSAAIEKEITLLSRAKKDMHGALMKEQNRAAKSRAKGEKSIDERKWPTVVSKAKVRRAEQTSGLKKAAITTKKHELNEQLSNIPILKIIRPKFTLTSNRVDQGVILSISRGMVAYEESAPILQNINLSLVDNARIAIMGENGCGKSTLIKAILADNRVIRQGDWYIPKKEDIGYLDQHYDTLSIEKTVFETVAELMPNQIHAEVRRFLNDFLFSKNEEVNAPVSRLSGGEKARLSLAHIAAKTPRLLILDEPTNNIDLQTKEHIVNVLKEYPGAMIVISHEPNFVKSLGIKDTLLLS